MKKFSVPGSRFPVLAALAASLCFLPAAIAEDSRAPSAALPAVDHYVYLSFLPEPSELQADAKKNGLEILRLDKTADAVIVSYRYADGSTATLGYKKLDAASAADRVASRTIGSSASYTVDRVESVPTRTTVVERTVVRSEPEVVYVERPTTTYVYRDRWDDFWAPLTIGVGIGYIGGHYSHHHHYRPHYRYHGHHHWGGHRYHGSWRGHHHHRGNHGHRGGHRRH